MDANSKYELVVGLEVHAQLQTASKLFCGDSIAYGAGPNTQVSPVTLGHPGTLPKMNRKAVEHAIRLGLACQCEIERNNYFARKNYFYPDLPKGYQISQHTTPICKGGFIKIQTAAGEKKIRLNRIHMEEDAGKSIHDVHEQFSAIDYNRAGTPLVEMVTEPDIRSSEEAFAYLTEVRKLVRYLDVCDGNMEEGSLRCDANISLRLKGEQTLGTKVEIKNLNSIRNVKRAIDAEAERLAGLLDIGEPVIQQTRSFDANTGKTIAIRDKEDADDYRYFPDPDLTPFLLEERFIQRIQASLPVLQEARIQHYISALRIGEYEATVITDDRAFADYFEVLAAQTGNAKAAANWMLGPVKTWLNEHNEEAGRFPLAAAQLGKLIGLVESGKLSFSMAAARLFPQLLEQPDKDPEAIAVEGNMLQQSDAGALAPVVDAVLQKLSAKVEEYKKGKKGLLALFVGEVMKQTNGKADPRLTNELLLERLNKK